MDPHVFGYASMCWVSINTWWMCGADILKVLNETCYVEQAGYWLMGEIIGVCVVCLKYWIIILIIIITNLGQILLSYISNTSHNAVVIIAYYKRNS